MRHGGEQRKEMFYIAQEAMRRGQVSTQSSSGTDMSFKFK
jgi:hypothetical protein